MDLENLVSVSVKKNCRIPSMISDYIRITAHLHLRSLLVSIHASVGAGPKVKDS